MKMRNALMLGILFLAVLWAFAFWPGLHTSWYCYDDYFFAQCC